MANIGNLAVQITANSSQFSSTLEKAGQEAEKLAKRVQGAFGALKSLPFVGGAFGALDRKSVV